MVHISYNQDEAKEQLLYLLKFTDHYIETLICNVLSDSVSDPEYSAVTTANLIKCYIDVMKTQGRELPYEDVKGYFEYNCFTGKEFECFEQKRIMESCYYKGKQY